jgi:hypothetical protein
VVMLDEGVRWRACGCMLGGGGMQADVLGPGLSSFWCVMPHVPADVAQGSASRQDADASAECVHRRF